MRAKKAIITWNNWNKAPHRPRGNPSNELLEPIIHRARTVEGGVIRFETSAPTGEYTVLTVDTIEEWTDEGN